MSDHQTQKLCNCTKEILKILDKYELNVLQASSIMGCITGTILKACKSSATIGSFMENYASIMLNKLTEVDSIQEEIEEQQQDRID